MTRGRTSGWTPRQSLRDTALMDGSLRQAVCCSPCPDPKVREEGVPVPQNGVRGEFCLLRQNTEMRDWERIEWGWEGREEEKEVRPKIYR